MPCRQVALFTLFVLLGGLGVVPASEWSRFRGPNGTGVADSGELPIRFGLDENVVWKTPLPEGRSSPILTGDRIFLTAFEGDELLTYALDRATGEILWRKPSPRNRVTKVDGRNDAASPSPSVDDDGVYVFFPDFGLVAYDHDGKERWRYPLEAFDNIYGMGASPIVAEDKVILVCDQSVGSYILALKRTRERSRGARSDRRPGAGIPHPSSTAVTRESSRSSSPARFF